MPDAERELRGSRKKRRVIKKLILGISALLALGVCAWMAQYFILKAHYLKLLEPGQPLEVQIEAAHWLSERRIVEAIPGLVRCAAEHYLEYEDEGDLFGDDDDDGSEPVSLFDRLGEASVLIEYLRPLLREDGVLGLLPREQRSDDEDPRYIEVIGLSAVPSTDCLEYMRTAMEEDGLGYEVVFQLRRFGSPAVPCLRRALADEELFEQVVLSLAALGPTVEGSLESLEFAYESGNSWDRPIVLAALISFGKSALPAFYRALRDDEFVESSQEALRLGSELKLGEELLFEFYVEALMSPHETVVRESSELLAAYGEKSVPAFASAIEVGRLEWIYEAFFRLGPILRGALPALAREIKSSLSEFGESSSRNFDLADRVDTLEELLTAYIVVGDKLEGLLTAYLVIGDELDEPMRKALRNLLDRGSDELLVWADFISPAVFDPRERRLAIELRPWLGATGERRRMAVEFLRPFDASTEAYSRAVLAELEDGRMPSKAIAALPGRSDELLRLLVDCLSWRHPPHREEPLRLLSLEDPARVRVFLREAWSAVQKGTPAERGRIAWSISRLLPDDAEFRADILSRIGDLNESVSSEYLRALIGYKSTEVETIALLESLLPLCSPEEAAAIACTLVRLVPDQEAGITWLVIELKEDIHLAVVLAAIHEFEARSEKLIVPLAEVRWLKAQALHCLEGYGSSAVKAFEALTIVITDADMMRAFERLDVSRCEIAHLRAALQSSDKRIRLGSARLAEKLGPKAVDLVPVLLKIAARDSAWLETSQAIIALAAIDSSRLPPIEDVWFDFADRPQIFDLLAVYGAPSLPYFRELIRSFDADSGQLVRALESLPEEVQIQLVDDLATAILSIDARVAAFDGAVSSALKLFARLAKNHDGALEALVRHLGRGPAHHKAALHLVSLGERGVRRLARAMESNESSSASIWFAFAAGRIGVKASPTIPSLRKMLSSASVAERSVAAQALGRMGKLAELATDDLKQLATSENEVAAASARAALHRIENDFAGPSSDTTDWFGEL